MHKVILDQINSNTDTLKYINNQIADLSAVDALLTEFDLSDVSSVSVYRSGVNTRDVTLTLKNQGSKLPHQIAQQFGIKLTKSKAWDGKSLIYSGRINDDWYISIGNAVPASCTVEYSEEPIPENQIVRTRKVAKIVCPGADSEA